MENQPHATRPRSTAGRLAPFTPNDARASTGNGTPYRGPTRPMSTMGTSTMQLARNTSHTAICQVKPWSSMELAMV